MNIKEVQQILGAEFIGGYQDENLVFDVAFASDLMSDVLAYIKENCLFLSGLTNEQTVRTAALVDINAIVFVRNKRPGENVVKLANDNKITLLTTKCTMYLACGKLYAAGLPGYSIESNTV